MKDFNKSLTVFAPEEAGAGVGGLAGDAGAADEGLAGVACRLAGLEERAAPAPEPPSILLKIRRNVCADLGLTTAEVPAAFSAASSRVNISCALVFPTRLVVGAAPGTTDDRKNSRAKLVTSLRVTVPPINWAKPVAPEVPLPACRRC
jgi:hypothetical protein